MLHAAVPPGHADFLSIVHAVAAEPRVVCLGVPAAVTDADREQLRPLLQVST